MTTWLITGCSTGFGRELATTALDHGDRVVLTARNTADIADLASTYADQAVAVPLDVTDPDLVASAVAAATEHFQSIDVLVNNAGISYFAGVEESDETAVRHLFDVNFFGLMRMTHAVLPLMRAQRSGTIVNMASIAGLNGFPSVGYYCASKFAVEGVSEALAHEIVPFGIRMLLVEPSGFRTDWARSSSSASRPIAAYDDTPLRAMVENATDTSTPQAGNPSKAAEAIYRAVVEGGTNLHLPLGAGSIAATTAKLDALRAEYDALADLARSVDDPS